MSVRNIAIFASGSGSNTEKIIEYFKDRDDVHISAVYTNNRTAGVLKKAKNRNVDTVVFDRSDFYNSELIINDLQRRQVKLIILAGFLWLIPESLIDAFPDRIINIHPALLPNYGGKGMYGIHVHRAVSQAGESETGITVHFVNKEYDKGRIISQIRCPVIPNESPNVIAAKVLKVEHLYYPQIIDQLLENKYFQG